MTTLTLPCELTACGEPMTVQVREDGDRLRIAGYEPACNHHQTPKRLLDLAAQSIATSTRANGGDPHALDPEDRSSGERRPGIAEPGAAAAEARPCWCGEYAYPPGHSLVRCDSEAGRARDQWHRDGGKGEPDRGDDARVLICAPAADRGDVAGIITGQKLRQLEEAGYVVVKP